MVAEKGLSAAAKKSGRAASEGLVGVVVDGLRAAVVELNAETDFVARNAQFQDLVEGVTQAALGAGHNLEALKVASFPRSERCVADEVTHAIASIGENMNLRRSALLEVASGAVAGYVHAAVRPGLGKIGALVALESSGDATRLAEVGRQIAMHIAAAGPLYLDRAAVDPAALERERDVLSEQARASGKPEEVIAKMVEGRLRKFYEEVCLLDQTFVIDGERRVSDVVDQLAKELGTPVVLKGLFALCWVMASKSKSQTSQLKLRPPPVWEADAFYLNCLLRVCLGVALRRPPPSLSFFVIRYLCR